MLTLGMNQRLGAGFLVILLMILAMSSVVYVVAGGIEADVAAVSRSFEASRLVDDASKHMGSQESGVRGFVMTGDEDFLDPYKFGRQGYDDAFGALSRLLTAPEDRKQLDAMADIVGHWRSEIADREIAWMRQPGSAAKALDQEKQAAGKWWTDQFTAVTEHLRQALDQRLAERRSTLARAERRLKILAVGAGIAVALVSLATSLVLRQSITRPVVEMTAAMNGLAEGHTDVHIPGAERKDEIGAMAKAVAVFRSNKLRADELTAAQAAATEARLARQTLIEERSRDFDRDAARLMASFQNAAGLMRQNAESLAATAGNTDRQSNLAAAAVKHMGDNVETVSMATAGLETSISGIGLQVRQSTDIAQQAVVQAERSAGIVEGLHEATSRIGEIVTLINGIAHQTNMLALNATIEAARAGEAGKGFAVVANEVKTLANQTSKATAEIGAQISAIQEATTDSVEAIRGVNSIIADINSISSAIAQSVVEQQEATAEIARNLCQATEESARVTEAIGAVTSAAGLTERSADEVLAASTALTSESEELRCAVETFLADIKTA